MIKHSKKIIGGILILLFVAFFYRSCVPHKLNEVTFYKDESIELKVVRYLEVMPLHYNGPVFRIGCRSKNTQPKAWHKIQDRGWTEIRTHPGLVNLGWDPHLDVLSSLAKGGYHITDVDTMIYETLGIGIEVTWDACGSFISWTVNKIPEEYVNPDGYLTCVKDSKIKEASGALAKGWGEANCKSNRFYNSNKPTFFDMEAKRTGYASFKVSSKAFLSTELYSVETHNYGKSWNLIPIQER